MAWIISTTGSLDFVDLGQLPFVAISILATYSLASQVIEDKKIAQIVCWLPAFAPIVFAQATAAYVDVMVMALTLSSLALILSLDQKSGSWFQHLAIMVGIGFLFGTKLSAIGPWFVLSLVYLQRAGIKRGLVGLLSALALGGHQYILNALRFHNPVYPFEVPTLGLTGPFDRADVWVASMAQGNSWINLFLRSWIRPVVKSGVYDLKGQAPAGQNETKRSNTNTIQNYRLTPWH